MKLVKCPRCDLNYITESEKYCKVCLQEMKGDRAQDEVELCSICNQEPVLPGRDVCIFCLKEMNNNENNQEEDSVSDHEPDLNELEDDDVAMEDLLPDVADEDIPNDLENELSLESVREDEEREAKDDETDDDM